MKTDLRSAYKTIVKDQFPGELTISFGTGTLRFKKRTWKLEGDNGGESERGLRYGENPGQPAALYELRQSDLHLEGAQLVKPGTGLVGSIGEENLIRSGKHPGKINLTDIDSAALILRYLADSPACAIIKHNNPCAVACGETAEEAIKKAYMADPLASFGGCVVVNRPLSVEGARFLSGIFIEVIACSEFEQGTVPILEKRRNLRIVRLPRLGELKELADTRFLDFKALSDGSLIVQLSASNPIRKAEDFLPARTSYKETEFEAKRKPTEEEYQDLIFGWTVQQATTSNSVLFAKNLATVSIGSGGQDRVGVVKQAVSKAFERAKDRLTLQKHGMLFFELALSVKRGEKPQGELEEIERQTQELGGGLRGSVLVSDGFFPKRDGIDLAIEAGATCICHPGGSIRDWEAIQAANEADPQLAMVFTGQRAFRH